MADTEPLIPKTRDDATPRGRPVVCRGWYGWLILLLTGFIISGGVVAFEFYPTPLGGCANYTCDWAILWNRMSGCRDGFCVYEWQVIVNTAASSVGWTGVCDYGNYTNACVYMTNNTNSPPYSNNTNCYRPRNYFCDTYYTESNWWYDAACQPVFNCTLMPQTSSRNTLTAFIGIFGAFTVVVTSVIWYCGLLNAKSHGVSCYIVC